MDNKCLECPLYFCNSNCKLDCDSCNIIRLVQTKMYCKDLDSYCEDYLKNIFKCKNYNKNYKA